MAAAAAETGKWGRDVGPWPAMAVAVATGEEPAGKRARVINSGSIRFWIRCDGEVGD
jgi:hypothetical protein